MDRLEDCWREADALLRAATLAKDPEERRRLIAEAARWQMKARDAEPPPASERVVLPFPTRARAEES